MPSLQSYPSAATMSPSAPPANANILAIPAEITEHALVLAAPQDVANFAQTCRSARALVYEAHDQHLWRRLFLEQSFDDPRNDPRYAADPDALDNIDWKAELQKRVKFMRVIRNWRDSGPDLLDALPELVKIARDAPIMPVPDNSKDLAWIASLLKDHPPLGIRGRCLSRSRARYFEASRSPACPLISRPLCFRALVPTRMALQHPLQQRG